MAVGRLAAALATSLMLAALTVIQPARADEAQAGETLTRAGQPLTVIDADTLQIGPRIIQLAGIDAPELGQACMNDGEPYPCGLQAAFALHKFVVVNIDRVACQVLKNRKPLTARCAIDRQDLSHLLLTEGYAVATPTADPALKAAEAGARKAELGIWRGPFILPSKWRDGDRLPEEKESDGDACLFLGNILGLTDQDGHKLYYVQNDPEFEEVSAEAPAAFCSDDEARAAGWRRPHEAIDH